MSTMTHVSRSVLILARAIRTPPLMLVRRNSFRPEDAVAEVFSPLTPRASEDTGPRTGWEGWKETSGEIWQQNAKIIENV